jgi:radical SAM protein with 4Fe4S-binding SPASM domain
MTRLLDQNKVFRVVTVVRPDSVAELPAGLDFLFDHGVRRFDPSLDLWATWTLPDVERLRSAIGQCADFWAERLPDCGVSWFDEKLARISQVPTSDTARCGFGHSEIAVAPSGALYPCERLIGEDRPDNPMRLAGSALDGDDFLDATPAAGKSAAECHTCAINPICSTTCRCSNYVRTGDIGRPDGLLCVLDQTCYRETVRAVKARTQLVP